MDDEDTSETRKSATFPLGTAIAALSLVVSLSSAWFSHEQAKIARDGQLTPFRAIIYSSKLAAFQNVASQMRAFSFKTQAPLFRIGMDWQVLHNTLTFSMASPGPASKGARYHARFDPYATVDRTHKDLADAINLYSAEERELSKIMIASAVVWTPTIYELYEKVSVDMTANDNCFLAERSAAQIASERKTASASLQVYLSLVDCLSTMRSRQQVALRDFSSLESAMRQDIRADQLQAVPDFR